VHVWTFAGAISSPTLFDGEQTCRNKALHEMKKKSLIVIDSLYVLASSSPCPRESSCSAATRKSQIPPEFASRDSQGRGGSKGPPVLVGDILEADPQAPLPIGGLEPPNVAPP
jgi:hypothetical protein